MPIKAAYLLLAGAGGVVIWSGVKGKSVTNVFRSLVGGQNPATLPQTQNITGINPAVAEFQGGTSGSAPNVSGSAALGAGQLPTGPFQNAQAIYMALRAIGFTKIASAGIMGNIYQESHGNPQSSSPAGGGLFGLTLANGGSVNGGSLGSEINKLLHYIQQNGSVADINSHATDVTSAVDYFSNRYERPGIPALSTREAAGQWVFNQSWAQ